MIPLPFHPPSWHLGDEQWSQLGREQVEVRDRRLHETKWPCASKQKTVGADRLQYVREIVLGRSPDPRDVPPESRALTRREPPVRLLDERATSARDDDAHARIRAHERANVRGAQIGRGIERARLRHTPKRRGRQGRRSIRPP